MKKKITILPERMPDWMRQSRRGIDWGVLLVLLLSALAAWAFVLQPGLPRTNASENYVLRTADYAQALLEGRWYPRWSPNVFGGYGAPIPHFFAPAAPYVGALIQILVTDDPVLAVRALYILALTLAGAMTYVLVLRRAGAAAGVLAAALYIYSPYVGLTAPHILGDLPGVLALALLPAFLWSIDRLLTLHLAQDFPFVVFITAALFLTDLRYASSGLLLAAAYLFWQRRSGLALYTLSALVVGIVLASFYWLPAWIENSAVVWRAAAFRPLPRHLTFPEIFAPLRQIDFAELVVTPQFTLGWPHSAFLIAAVLTLLRARRRAAFQLMFLAVGAGLLLAALLFFPTQVWLMGVVSLCFAIAGSAVLLLRERLRFKRLLLPTLLLVLFVTTPAVWLSPFWPPVFGDTSALAQVDYERLGFGVAVLPAGTDIPSTLLPDLPLSRFLLEGYQSGLVSRIAPDQIGTFLQIGTLAHTSHSDSIQLTVNHPATLDVLTAYFPGWRATVNGEALPLSADPDTGLLQITLTQVFSGQLTISLDSTLPRAAAWGLAGSALLITLVIGWWRIRAQIRQYNDLDLLTAEEARLIALVLGVFLAAILVFALPNAVWSIRAAPGHALTGSSDLRSSSDIGLQGLSFRLPQERYRRGETITLEMFWRTSRPLLENYQTRAYLARQDDPESIYAATSLHPLGGYPTRRWIPYLYVRDRYDLLLPPNLDAGTYGIVIEVYNCNPFCATWRRATFFDAQGRQLGRTLPLPAQITVMP